MGSDSLRFVIEVDTTADPIEGTLRSEGAEIPFVGWIGLARGLERVLGLAAAPEVGLQPHSDAKPRTDEGALGSDDPFGGRR